MHVLSQYNQEGRSKQQPISNLDRSNQQEIPD
jgi:hypothetical protein